MADPRARRYDGLDRLRGVALALMLVHHLMTWTQGGARARELIGGLDGFIYTDMTAPMFGFTAGAAAALSGARLRARGGPFLLDTTRRWAVIGLWGMVLGFSIDADIDTFGVLESLAVVGFVMTVITARVTLPPIAWGLVGLGLTTISLRVIERFEDSGGAVGVIFAGKFPVVSYLALGAWGASVSTWLSGHSERGWRLPLAAVKATAILVVLTHTTDWVWPADRSPGGPAFIVPGVVGSLLCWVVVAHVGGRLGDHLATVGRRTLEVFLAHYVIRTVIDLRGDIGRLQSTGWVVAALVTAAVIFVAAGLPWRRREQGVREGFAQAGDGEPTAIPADPTDVGAPR